MFRTSASPMHARSLISRCFSFRLRTLLGVVALIAVPLGGYRHQLALQERQQRCLHDVQELHGRWVITHGFDGKNTEGVDRVPRLGLLDSVTEIDLFNWGWYLDFKKDRWERLAEGYDPF